MLLPRKWALGLGVLLAAPALSVAGAGETPANAPTRPAATSKASKEYNEQIAREIAKALSKADLVHKNVHIEYLSGVATITGEVQNSAQRETVTRVTRQVSGVKSVHNDLTLMDASTATAMQRVQHAEHVGPTSGAVQPASFEPAGPSSDQMAQQIADALTSSGLSGYDIEIRYKSGMASLIGSVESKDQVMRAHQAATSVPGVQQVFNKLTVNGQPVATPQMQGYPTGAPAGIPGVPGAAPQPYPAPQAYAQNPQQVPQQAYQPTAGQAVQQAQAMAQGMPPAPVQYGNVQPAGHQLYNQPYVPEYAWPSYAPYPNSAAVTYPTQYDASAWPYIGPYYPYPQVPLGWRKSTLEWKDGNWQLSFNSRTDRWWWFLNPHNWH